MGSERTRQSLDNLARALDRLREALAAPMNNELMVDGLIQRFEFSFELFWKAVKRVLEDEGVTVGTPKEALRAAYQAGWLETEEAWLQMLHDRNLSSHVYDEAAARAIAGRARTHCSGMEAAFLKLRARVGPA
jgi:nucleotidyltransferase substrate binding protein (TIGR01987 family)